MSSPLRNKPKLSDWDTWPPLETKPSVVEQPKPLPQALPKPNQFKTIRLTGAADKSADEKFAMLGPLARRYGRFPKGTVLPETRVQVCPRVKIADLPARVLGSKVKYLRSLEQNQLIKACCRHPENHAIEGWKSHPEELAPDNYIIICDQCGAEHKFFCAGEADERPAWGAE